ncbi:MAG: phosphate ABC transporter substrate-binding protein PstS [Thermoprotei archaeon]
MQNRKAKIAVTKIIYIGIIIILIVVVTGIIYARYMTPNTSSTTTSAVVATIRAGGSTFVNPQMQKWIQDFSRDYPSISVTYDSVGSGTGASRFLQGVYDIGASDVPLPNDLWNQAVQRYGAIITIPDVVGSIGMVYNLPSFTGILNMTAEVIAKIYTGKIQYWDDSSIASINPGFHFPHEKIIAVHRSDGSGTTFVFTLYLQKAASDVWNVGAGYTVNWPVDSLGNGLGGKGNEGVTAYVVQNKYSIGYVEYQYAILNNLQTAWLKNHDGYFVPLTKDTVIAALNNVDLSKLPKPTEDWSSGSSLLLDIPGKNAYPIVSFSYLIIKKDYQDQNKAMALYLFLKYILSHQQSVLNGYLPLPDNIINYVINNGLNEITVNGKPVYTMLQTKS